MSDLISLVVVDQEPRVDSRLIAKQLGVDHQNTRELIQQYQSDLEEFGLIRFETGAVKKEGARGTKYEKFALLNEDQSYLVLTYTQNTPQARALKKRLVRAFGEQRKALANPPIDPLAAQIAVLIRGKVLVDYATLGQLTRVLWAAHGLLDSVQELARKLEQQCGKPLIYDQTAQARALDKEWP